MNIFVAKLDYSTTAETLQEVFEQFGEVSSAKVIMDKETGQSRGFGFVEMPNDDEGNSAISELDGTELDGRTIVVKEATPRDNRSRGGGGGRFNRGGGGGFNRGGGGDRFNRGGGGDRFNRGGGGDRFNRGGGGGRFNRNDRFNKRDDNW